MLAPRLINFSLVTLWTAVIACTLIWGAWLVAPALVNKVDQVFRDAFLYQPLVAFSAIAERLEETGDQAKFVKEHKALLGKLEAVQRVDELANLKRAIYQELVLSLTTQLRLDEAFDESEQWLAFDPRDINALLAHSRLLYLNPERQSEGLAAMQALKSRFPNSLAVANGIATIYATRGEMGQAFLEYLAYLPNRNDPLRRNIGELITTVTYIHKAGETPEPLSLKFGAGEIIDITVNRIPAEAEVPFNTTGLLTTATGFRKRPGSGSAYLELAGLPPDQDLKLDVSVRVAVPETLEIMQQQRFHTLVRQQLEALKRPDAVEAYDALLTTS